MDRLGVANNVLSCLALENNSQPPSQLSWQAIQKWRVLMAYAKGVKNEPAVPTTHCYALVAHEIRMCLDSTRLPLDVAIKHRLTVTETQLFMVKTGKTASMWYVSVGQFKTRNKFPYYHYTKSV